LIRSREEHNISRKNIDPDALRVLYRLSKNGFIAYLVGGGVRDLLLGRTPKDFDISTNARPEQVRAMFRNCILIGRRFRLAHIRYGDKIIETSTFRGVPVPSVDPADPEADLFQRDDNLFGTPREDALRRDFTVNGLFYDIGSFSVIDYVGGMEDLAECRIRAIGDPGIRFREDPVRMIRAVRFASRLNFEIAPATLDAIHKHKAEIMKASSPRLLEELCRLFAFASGERAVRLLDSTGLLQVFLPEATALLDAGEGETTRKKLWRRLAAMDQGDTVMPEPTPALIFSALLVDPLLKYLWREWDAGGFPRLRYDRITDFLRPIAERLRFPRRLSERIAHIYMSQNRLTHPDPKKPGNLANFVVQASFHESLALAEILAGNDSECQTRLNPWREMLADRVYTPMDGGNGSIGRAGTEGRRIENGEGEEGTSLPVLSADDSLSPDGGKRLSRSSRRRRNRRHRTGAGQEGDLRPATEAAQPAKGQGEPEKETASVFPARPPDGESPGKGASPPVPAVDKTKSRGAGAGDRADGRRHRRRRKRGDRCERPEAGSVQGEGEPSSANALPPLTAAAFYISPGGMPEPGELDERRRKRYDHEGKRLERAADRIESRDAFERPFRPGRDESPDQPPHWLDEI
jgi:poly(A) polymerase